MAIQTIGYANKVTLNENTDVADVNKVKADDMNEIKSVVNANANLQGDLSNLNTTNKSSLVNAVNELEARNIYSTTEQVIGKWIDQKPIYRKVIEVTSISTSSINTLVDHNINNLNEVIKIYGIAYLNNQWEPISRVVPDGITTYGVGVGDVTATQFLLQVGNGYSTKTKAYIIIEYTKTNN